MKPRPLLLTTGITGLLLTLPLMAQQVADAAGKKPSDIEARLAKLEERLRSSEERVQWRGIHACVRMGEAAVPMLTRMFEERPKQGVAWRAPVAAKALVRLGPKAIECLPTAMKLLKNGNMAQHQMAMDVLGAVGPYGTDDSQDYMQAVYDEWQARGRGRSIRGRRGRRIKTHYVVACMLRLTEDPRMSMDNLIEHLQRDSAGHREMAVDWLALRGTEARPAITALVEVAKSDIQPTTTTFRFRGARFVWSGNVSVREPNRVRGKAALLLMKLGATKDIPAAAYVELLQHEDPAVRQRIVLTLGSFGAKVGSKGVRALARAVTDKDKLVAWDAITALGMIGPRAKAAVPRLVGLARGADKAKAARAEAALRQIQKDDNQKH